jgi:hypothetical protein
MSNWAWFAEGFCAGVVLMLAFVWLISVVVRIELAERERESR